MLPVTRPNRRAALILAALISLALPVLALGKERKSTAPFDKDTWCEESHHATDRHRVVHCEVRELELGAEGGAIAVDAGTNGGIKVEGWDRDEVRILAKVEAWAESEDEARELASRIEIETGGRALHATGPSQRDGWKRGRGWPSWGVSYRIQVPRRFDLTLETHNGGISVTDVSGALALRATNGSLALRGVSGDVHGRTTNGSLAVDLDGDRWEGAGLDLLTTNGSVQLAIPRDYSARLETGTTNGRMHSDIPFTVSGNIGRRIHTTLGEGGRTLRLITTNGAVNLMRAD